jgi:beta-lactamase class A
MYSFCPHVKPIVLCLASILSVFMVGAALVSPVAAVADGRSISAAQLPARTDAELQAALERLVRGQGLWSQVASRRLALGLVDITDIDAPRYAVLNPDHMMYAASLPKIAILLGAYVEASRGELQLDAGLRNDMVRMIRHSDNASATRVLEKVGREDLIDILTSDRLRLYDPARNGGLWVGKDYANANAYRRDPLHNLSHGATVHQVARFFYLLEKGELVDDAYRDDMKDILSKPGVSHKFVAGLRSRPAAQLFRKSGTWRDYHADAAMVESRGHRFILVGLAHHPAGGKWLMQLSAPMHDLVVDEAAAPAEEAPAAGREEKRLSSGIGRFPDH